MIRLATGDLSAVIAGESRCGRTNMRIKGWLGRAEQAARIDGVGAPPNDGVLIADERKAG
jgi:phenylacetate-CoA ligase